MARGFQTRGRGGHQRWLGLLLAVVIACFGMFELVRWLIPFDALNPLWSEATVGQSVLGNWKYGGQDAEGYLKFYDLSQTVLLPPNDRLFDANGRFIVIEDHTPSSVTYALPWNAIPFSWFAAGAGLVAMPLGLVVLRMRQTGGFRVRRRKGFAGRAGGSVRARGRRASPGTDHQRRPPSTAFHPRRGRGLGLPQPRSTRHRGFRARRSRWSRR